MLKLIDEFMDLLNKENVEVDFTTLKEEIEKIERTKVYD